MRVQGSKRTSWQQSYIVEKLLINCVARFLEPSAQFFYSFMR